MLLEDLVLLLPLGLLGLLEVKNLVHLLDPVLLFHLFDLLHLGDLHLVLL